MTDGDTGNTTSTVATNEAIVQGFADLRKSGTEPLPIAEVEQAVETQTEAPEVEAEPEVEPVREKVRFKIGDEEVDEDTLLDWKKNGLRQKDYTEKRMAEAARLREVETERAKEREQTLQKWQALEDAVASQIPKEPDWQTLRTQVQAGRLSEEDYQRFAASWLEQKSQLDQIKAEKQKAEELTKADRQKQQEATAKQNFERVMELLPDWKDEGKRQKDWNGMTGYVKEIAPDIEPDSLLGMHPALFKVLRDAHQYHLLQQSTSKPKVVKVDGTLKPGSTASAIPKTNELDTALRRVAQTNRDEDAVAAFRALRKAGAGRP